LAARSEHTAVAAQEPLQRATVGLVVEAAVRAGVAAVGLVEVAVGVLRGGRLVALLPLDGGRARYHSAIQGAILLPTIV